MANRILCLLSLGVITAAARAADLPPINSPATTDHFAGKIVWDDLFTTDPASAVKFYTGLFGWTSEEIVRPNRKYTVMSLDGRPIAGITMLPEKIAEASGNTAHGRWVGFASVDDVSKATAAFSKAGGKVLFAVKELAQRGTQSIVETPDGVVLGLVHSSTGDPGDFKAESNEWVWSKFFVKDTASSSQLFHDALGYEVIPDIRQDKPDSFVLSSNDFARAALGPVPDRPNAKPGWLGFVRVESVDDTVAKAKGLGARVIVESIPGEGTGKMAILVDPTGAPFGVVQLDDSLLEEKP
jgi:predicted enzyme related to lactoylglutathione lyase